MRLAHRLLGDSAALVRDYLHSQVSVDGGFCDRGGRADLYYTVFGLEGLAALGEAAPGRSTAYLRGFGTGEGLDLVHLCCLIRCRASAGLAWTEAEAGTLAARLEGHRAAAASAYDWFLLTMANEDLGWPMPDRESAVGALLQLRTADGGFANQPDQPFGLTPSTAAVATLLKVPGLESWLLSRHCPQGGFFAIPGAPIPDLLSTATALHALASMGASLEAVREPCLDFVQSLWTGGGAFCGSWADPTADCEYTYYGLLALGSLAT